MESLVYDTNSLGVSKTGVFNLILIIYIYIASKFEYGVIGCENHCITGNVLQAHWFANFYQLANYFL